jgi:hypothetical protein
MSNTLFLIFNHQITPQQTEDARRSLNIREIIQMPDDIKAIWGNVPPHLSQIRAYLDPVKTWLASQAEKGDYALIQGDFGACYLMANFAFEKDLIPVYSTTRREAADEYQADGSVKMVHQFKHQIFRKYGE